MKKAKRQVLIGTLISFLIPLVATLIQVSIYLDSKKEGFTNEPYVEHETYVGYGVLLNTSSGTFVPDFWNLILYGGITIVVPIFTYFILKYLSET